MLGGSSCINGATWVRGNPGDFDHWRQLGNRGWAYADVLPFFKKMERYEGGGEARGKSGPIEITTVSRTATPVSRLYESFFEASESVGIKTNEDYNGEDQEGVGMAQGNISRRGIRMSTAECYLKPARGRSNLDRQDACDGAKADRAERPLRRRPLRPGRRRRRGSLCLA